MTFAWLPLIFLAIWAAYVVYRLYGRHLVRQAERAHAAYRHALRAHAIAEWNKLNRHGRRATFRQAMDRPRRKTYLVRREQELLKKLGGRSGLYSYVAAS